MNTKQLVALCSVIVLTTAGITFFTFLEPMSARSECSEWAMNRTKGILKSSFVEGSNDMLPVGPSPESVSQVTASYDLHYNFCVREAGYGN